MSGLSGGRAMLELAERCEKATGPDRELWDLDRAIKAALLGREYISFEDDLAKRQAATPPRYTTSLDAAMTLIPDTWRLIDMCETVIEGDLPWYVRLREKRFDVSPGSAHSDGATPALALVAAALRARAADTPAVKP